MRISLVSWFVFNLYIATFLSIAAVLVSGRCQSDQQESLLGFRNSIDSSLSVKLVKWNESTDCCSWDGITCDAGGRVIQLDLSNQSISGEIDKSNSLFRLRHLRQLNLAYNRFTPEFPSGFENLTNLSYLNLSHASFVGQIPVGISRLTKLITLDLSTSPFLGVSMKLEKPNIAMLVLNLTRLKHLYLDGVNISANENEWSQTLPSFLPNLQVLSMSYCYLSGTIDPSLSKLKFLSIIRLGSNNLSGPFPEEILQAPKLQTLDLSFNEFLQGSFQKFPPNASLQSLIVRDTKFEGQLPESIGNLGELTSVDLAYCKFNGTIPKTLEKLTQLMHLDFSYNNFSGPVPSFTSLRNLTGLFLAENQLTGSIHSTNWSSLLNLVSLDLRRNSFNGTVPAALFQCPTLEKLDLSENQFTGGFSEVKGKYSSLLESIDLSHNRLQGPFPMFVFEIQSLVILSLSWNQFSGLILMSAIQKLTNLTDLDLSYNNLSIDSSLTNPSLPPLRPNIDSFDLASCNLTKFPDFLKNISTLGHLDLSNNRIHGEIPSWIWEFQNLYYLNLSLNFLVELETPLNITTSLLMVDLHGNQLQGQNPIFPPYAIYLDYSSNNFTSVLPPEIGDILQSAYFFSLSGNKFYGSIPETICHSPYLKVLDMSNNSLSGHVPRCLIQMSVVLGVLNLKRNNLNGKIPDAFPSSCSLQTLDLNQNQLGGKIPKSLANCRMLEILDLGNNQIDDTFPCHLKNTSRLRVLVLRSNKFKGDVNCRGNNVTWPMLQIIDLASNSFSGKLPQGLLKTWNAMKAEKYEPYSKHLRFKVLQLSELYFQDSMTVIMKGQKLELMKILTIFTSIDFSSNKFEGHIPEAMGDFKALYLLNLSNNTLAGTIPSFLGNLSKLEALDLSSNHLTGQIPLQLANLNFLSFLNLSNNKLTGKIPSGTQIQSFSEASFENNAGLCGLPLDVQCEPPSATKDYFSDSEIGNNIDWNLISIEIGFVFGLGVVIVPLMFWKRWRVWYYKRIDRVLYNIFPKLDRRNRYRGTIARWPQGRRP